MDSICPARLEFAQYGAKLHRKVKDDHNCDFILKLFAKIGLAVPGTIHPQRALIEIAKEQDLLGDTATTTDIEACEWIFCWVSEAAHPFVEFTRVHQYRNSRCKEGMKTYLALDLSLISNAAQPVRHGHCRRLTCTGGCCSMPSAGLVGIPSQGAFG